MKLLTKKQLLLLLCAISLKMSSIADEINEAYNVCYIRHMPDEIRDVVSSILENSRTWKSAAKNIKSLSRTNEAIDCMLCNPFLLNKIISRISLKFNIDQESIERFFGMIPNKKRFADTHKNYQANTPGARDILKEAVHNNDVPLLSYLFRQGIDINDKIIDPSIGTTPLLLAAKLGKIAVVDFLLNKGAEINRQDIFGNTPLLISIGNKNSESIEIVKLLLNRGADVNKADKKGQTPLMIAVTLNDSAKVKLLIDKGANPLIKDKKRKTVLARIRKNTEPLIKGLLKKNNLKSQS